MGTHVDDTHTIETIAPEPSNIIPGWQEGIPLIRLFACGPFTVEVLHEVPAGDPGQARYVPLPPERLHGRGPAPALTFLKLLTSQPDRYAPKDWLIEHLRGDEYLITPKRLENIVSFVRQLLSLPDGTKPPGMLRYVRASHESGDGYRLAPYPLIWLDVDALAHTVRQACLLERFGDDPLPQWERAYQLVSRGTYLAEEPYSDWAEARREEVEGHLRQCVHALARLWLARHGTSAEEEVLHLLRGYWSRHPEDEDVAWGLMDLLGRRGCYQEALSVYAVMEQSLEEQGLTKEGQPRVPDQRTRDLADYLRLKERQPLISQPSQREVAQPSPAGARVQHDGIPARSAPLMTAPGYDSMLSHFSHAVKQGIREAVLSAHQSLALPLAFWEMPSDDAAMGMWVARSAALLGPMLDASWSFDALIEPLRIIVPVVKAMPIMTRRTFLQAGAAATMLGGLSLLDSKQISEEESAHLCLALGESIQTSWKRFLSTENKVMLATGQALLALVQQTHPLLYPAVRPFLYTGAYSLIGIALHFQERGEEALQAYQSSYIAALSSGDPWYVAQSLICQSDSYHTLGQYDQAIQKIEEALRILGNPTNEAQRRAKAHLLTCWADNAMMLADYTTAQEKLEASTAYLDQLPANEEFDRAGWLLLAGKYALLTGEYAKAIQAFDQALAELPEQWTLRRAMTATGLAMAYARLRERDESLQVAQSVAPVLEAINAPKTNRWFTQYLQQDLLDRFPTDERVRAFVTDTYRRLPQLANSPRARR